MNHIGVAPALFVAALALAACKSGGDGPSMGPGGETGTGSSTSTAGATGTGGSATTGTGGSATTGAGGSATTGAGGTSGYVGEVCLYNGGCLPPNFCGALDRCTAACKTDADCTPAAGTGSSHCVTTTSGDGQCFMGCTTDADCKAIPGNTPLLCRNVSGLGICTAKVDTGTPPACQPAVVNTDCKSDADCACGQTCITSAVGGNCGYPCPNGGTDCANVGGGLCNGCNFNFVPYICDCP